MLYGWRILENHEFGKEERRYKILLESHWKSCTTIWIISFYDSPHLPAESQNTLFIYFGYWQIIRLISSVSLWLDGNKCLTTLFYPLRGEERRGDSFD
jgi:hypothetical protein